MQVAYPSQRQLVGPLFRSLRAVMAPSDVREAACGLPVPTISISPAGRAMGALNDAIAHAKKAWDGASESDLRGLSDRTRDRIVMRDWIEEAGELAKEVPKDGDDARLEIARRATSFVQRLTSPSHPSGCAQENPFYGMSRSDLAAIAYDETGRFTTNERRAAFNEAGRQAGDWSAEVCARGSEERARTGKKTDFLRAILAYYDALPRVEQAATPIAYMDRLREAVAASEAADISG